MIGLSIRFPAGRYHATPWGSHVNEAAVEWPPSPWRLLRALDSAWHRTAPDLEASEVRDVLDALSLPPSYRLLPAVPGHTRHYMPDRAHRREVQLSQTLVFDAFLRLDPSEPLIVRWDASLSESQVAALRRLAAGVTYLGRSESWCEVEVTDGGAPNAWGMSAAPLEEADPPPGHEVVRLLAPVQPVDLRALEVSTAELQGGRQKRRDPPGARWLRYARPERWAGGRRRPRPRDRELVADAVVWALEGSPPPLLTQAEEVALTVRRLIRLGETEATGRLHVLPYPSQPDARPVRLDRIALWAEGGLDAHEVDVACRLKPFAVPGTGGTQVPLLLWYGWCADSGDRLFGRGRTWRSITPLLPWRSIRIGGPAKMPASDAPRRLVADVVPRRLGAPSDVGSADGPVRWLDFRRGLAIGARLEFPAPVAGPVVAELQPPGFGLFLRDG
jgi:CRISPR-associated protein Csb2